MEITGALKSIGEAQQVSEKFKKREFVITDNSSQYPQHISFQLTQDKCNLIDQYNVGDELKVHFNLRGREWTSPKGEVKYFNTLESWRIEGDTAEYKYNVADEEKPENKNKKDKIIPDDDLPF